jgi:hypothetical protein
VEYGIHVENPDFKPAPKPQEKIIDYSELKIPGQKNAAHPETLAPVSLAYCLKKIKNGALELLTGRVRINAQLSEKAKRQAKTALPIVFYQSSDMSYTPPVKEEKKDKAGNVVIGKDGKPVLEVREKGFYTVKALNGLVCLDFDDHFSEDGKKVMQPFDVEDAKRKAYEEKCVLAAHVSPSGDGIRVLVMTDSHDLTNYEHTYTTVADFFGKKLGLRWDKTCSNVDRGMYLSHDPSLLERLPSHVIPFHITPPVTQTQPTSPEILELKDSPAPASHADDPRGQAGASELEVKESPLPVAKEEERDDIEAILPARGIIRDYFLYKRGKTESPSIYHYSSILTLCGACIGKRRWIPEPARVYPNLFTVNVGPSSSRKSTALTDIRSILNHLPLLKDQKPLLPFPVSSSCEAVEELLLTEDLFLVSSEYGKIINDTSSYKANLRTSLLDVYGCPEEILAAFKNAKEGKKGSSRIKIEHPFVCILSDSCPEYLQIDQADQTGGFLGRHIFAYASKREGKVYDPEETPLHRLQDWTRACDALRVSKSYVTYTEEARELKNRNYDKVCAEEEKKGYSPAEMSWIGKMNTIVKKIALIYETQETGSTSISGENMRKAITAGWMFFKHFQKTFGLINRSGEERAAERVLAVIQKARVIQRKDLLPRVHMPSRELQPVLTYLEETGKIIIEEKVNPQNKKPAFTYKAA